MNRESRIQAHDLARGIAPISLHESYHVTLYNMGKGNVDLDGDRLVDTEEGKKPYFFAMDDPKKKGARDTRDTYNLKTAKAATYKTYGDNEFLAIVAEDASACDKSKDWSKGGAQWGK